MCSKKLSKKTAQNNWRDFGRPSSCNAFATATFSSFKFSLTWLRWLLYVLCTFTNPSWTPLGVLRPPDLLIFPPQHENETPVAACVSRVSVCVRPGFRVKISDCERRRWPMGPVVYSAEPVSINNAAVVTLSHFFLC